MSDKNKFVSDTANNDPSVFSFKFKMNGQVKYFSVDIDKVFNIDVDDIKQELIDHPSIVAWVSILVGIYQKKAASAKDKLKIIEAELIQQKKAELAAAGERTSEYIIKSRVYADPKYKEATKELRKAEHDSDIILGLRKALDHKRDCLIQLSGLYKKEIDL